MPKLLKRIVVLFEEGYYEGEDFITRREEELGSVFIKKRGTK